MAIPKCEKCRYRHWLLIYDDIHVWGEGCDQYGSLLCQHMNEPDFIKWMDERNMKDGN